MTSAAAINELLADKLFQVVGSTPYSVAEGLRKIDLRGRTAAGGMIFTVAIFAAAVNRATMETFLADPRFASVRPSLIAALSIQGKANMTALTLLGHCFLTTKFADDIVFAAEFRRKMGQNHLWAGELTAGSLSDKQREILKEKKRVSDEETARALGNGFLKHVGLLRQPMTDKERELFNPAGEIPLAPVASAPAPAAASSANPRTPPRATPAAAASPSVSPPAASSTENFRMSASEEHALPVDVMRYRRVVIGQSDEEIAESIRRNGVDEFIRKTRVLLERDPTGKGTKAASVVAGR